MPLTRTQARDEILAVVKATADGLGDVTVVYDDVHENIPDAQAEPLPVWLRATLRHGPGGQSTLAGATGQRRYTKTGLLTIQLFTPAGEGGVKADTYSDTFEAAFRDSTSGGVWFRNVRSNEVGIDGPWFQTNILIEFEYDQIG